MATSVQSLLFFFFLGCLQMTAPRPTENEAWMDGPNGLKVFFGRKGGKIRIYRERQSSTQFSSPRPAVRSGQISISFGRIQEVDEWANPVSGYHGVSNPNDIEFTVTHYKDVSYMRTVDTDLGIRIDVMDCQTSLKDVNDALMRISVCAIKSNGTLLIDNQQLEMYPGLMKFFISLNSWPWSSRGKFIEIDLIITVPEGRTVRRKVGLGSNYPMVLELGADATANFTTKIKIDGTDRDMDHGYPKFSNNGGINTVTLRVPRFSSSAFYDPTVDPGYEATNVCCGGAFIQASISAISICAAIITCFTIG